LNTEIPELYVNLPLPTIPTTQPVDFRSSFSARSNFTVADVFAMQQLCGYDTVISGNLSSFCNSTAFTNEDWLSFEYANDLQYHYNLGYGFTESPSLGVPYLLAVTDFLLGSNLSTTLTEDYTDASNMTTPTEANATATQSLLISFSHREEPAFLATALGIFNNSVGIAASLSFLLLFGISSAFGS
jgi:acid phosphatase